MSYIIASFIVIDSTKWPVTPDGWTYRFEPYSWQGRVQIFYKEVGGTPGKVDPKPCDWVEWRVGEDDFETLVAVRIKPAEDWVYPVLIQIRTADEPKDFERQVKDLIPGRNNHEPED